MSDNYDVVHELARLLAEATRARRLAEAAAMDERCGARAFERNQAADEARRLAEQRADELKAAEAQIAELSAKLAEAEREAKQAREALDEREGDMHMRIRADYDQTVADLWRAKVAEVERERDEARAEVEKLTIDCAQISDANADLRCELAEARAALDAAHEHDAAEVTRLRGLIGEMLDSWDTIGVGYPHGTLYARARRATRGES